MKSPSLAKLGIPDNPGIYKFISKDGEILYIGKATNLKDRTKSYFSKDLYDTRGPLLVKMLEDAETIEYQVTDTVLEALILEVNLIKKHDPKYNTKEKDNKSYNYVCITCDEFPRVITVRGRLIDFKNLEIKGIYAQKLKSVFGPYPSGDSLRIALKIVRRIFPFLDSKSTSWRIKRSANYEFYKQLQLAPDVGLNNARKKYLNNIKNIELFFSGQKIKILKSLEKEMKISAKFMDFETAAELKKQIFALTHINDVSLLRSDFMEDNISKPNSFRKFLGSPSTAPRTDHSQKHLAYRSSFRIEAYDIAHLSGSVMVGAFSVVQNNEKNTEEYRLFNIKGFTSSNDAGALKEVISRRLNHSEWQLPDLIVADGNDIQKSVIEKELKSQGLQIPVVAVVKDKSHKARAILGDINIINTHKKSIVLANAEVHRFVLNHHKQKRAKNFLPKSKK